MSHLRLTAPSKNTKLVQNYTTAIRSTIRSYFLKSDTTAEDVAQFGDTALALINDMREVLHTAHYLSDAQRNIIQENITLLQMFASSLVVTKKKHFTPLMPIDQFVSIEYALAG